MESTTQKSENLIVSSDKPLSAKEMGTKSGIDPICVDGISLYRCESLKHPQAYRDSEIYCIL